MRVLDATGVGVEWVEMPAGAAAAEQGGDPLPRARCSRSSAATSALKGPVTTPVGKGFQSVNVALRHALDLYASLRPVQERCRA